MIYVEMMDSKLSEIKERRMAGGGFASISKWLGISVQCLINYITDATNITNNKLDNLITINKTKISNNYKISYNNKKSIKQFYIDLGHAWCVENERIMMVEEALYKSCFDHKMTYKTVSKKTGEIVEVEQIIPASYNAQRFYLINRCPKRWANENKDMAKENKDKPIQQIAVRFVDPNNEPTQRRVAQMMKEIEEENGTQR